MTTKTLTKEEVMSKHFQAVRVGRNVARTIREINEARAEGHITQAESNWLAHQVQKDIDQKLGQTW